MDKLKNRSTNSRGTFGAAIVSGAALLSFAATPINAAQAQTKEVQPSRVTGAQGKAVDGSSAWLRPSKMLVTPAHSIIGRDLTDQAGDGAGSIKYLMIRLGTGDVIYALASAPGSTQLFAVPWEAIDAADWIGWRNPGLRVGLTREQLQGIRRFDLDTIHHLTSPHLSREIAAKYDVGPRSEFKSDEQFLLHGGRYTTTIARPAVRVENQITGSKVATSDGQTIGEIDRVMIDVDEGKVAYVLVQQGGFLGGGGRWIAIPPQALQWNQEGSTYNIAKTKSELEEQPHLDEPTLSVFVRVSDLDKLYDFYGVDTYWLSN